MHHHKKLSWIAFGLGIVGTLGWGCIPKANTIKPDSTQTSSQKQTLTMSSGCIKGRIVDEKGKGMAYVFVKTNPTTTPAVTDDKGFFEFCYIRKSADGSQESIKLPLPLREYTVLVQKPGFEAKPQKVAYKGKSVSLQEIRLLEKSINPGGEVQDKAKEKSTAPTPSGRVGKIPIGGY